MNANEIHKMSQAAADLREHFVPSLWSYYDALVKQGFTEEQAFNLTKTYMKCILLKPLRSDDDV